MPGPLFKDRLEIKVVFGNLGRFSMKLESLWCQLVVDGIKIFGVKQ